MHRWVSNRLDVTTLSVGPIGVIEHGVKKNLDSFPVLVFIR